MRKTLLSTAASLFMALSMALLFTSNSGGRADVSGQGGTGAPGEPGPTCGSSSCHRAGDFSPVTASLTIQDAGGTDVVEYQPGDIYSVTVDIMAGAGNPQGYGFQLTTLDAANDNAGSYSDAAAGVQISTASAVGGREYIEHDGPSSTGSFSFNWTAPAAGTGDVTFYFNGNAVNANGNTLGDNAAGPQSFTLSEVPGAPTAIGDAEPGLINFDLAPSIASNFIQIGVEGLTGSYTAELYSLSGQLIKVITLNQVNYQLDISDLAAGPALIRISDEEGRSGVRRFVKQ